MNPSDLTVCTLLVAILCAAPCLAQQAHRNVILISLDQCRADELHTYGNTRLTSPNLDKMAAQGVAFTKFYSAAPWTAPSYSSMMTSWYPSRHGVTVFFSHQESAQRADAVMLAELFKKAGYETSAFVNNSVAGEYVTGRGFDQYDEGQKRAISITERSRLDNPEYQAPAVTDRVKAWLSRNHPKPFFLFLLYFEPHSPYNPPPQDDLFKSSAYPDMTFTGYDPITGKLFRISNIGDQKAIERLGQLYDGKIHFVDRYVGQLLDKLRASGLDKDTVVFLTSDHGELLYSHPDDFLTFDHRSLYDTVMHVPGILWGAGVPQGKRIDALSTHIDIAPTLLELAGLPPKPDAQGRTLVPLIEGKVQTVHPYVFGEEDILEPQRSVRDTRYKLILTERTGARQLFDLENDPHEMRNIVTREPAVAKRLGDILARWRAENEPPQAELLSRWRKLASPVSTNTIVDEVTTGAHLQLSGSGWNMADDPSCYKGGCYWSEPTPKEQTPKIAMWRSDNPMLGRYRISIWYGRLPSGTAATDVPFTIATRESSKTIRIDQSKKTGEWQDLGVYDDPLNVALNTRANGRVIVDAVKFERLP